MRMRAMLFTFLLLTLSAGLAYGGSRPGALTGSSGSNSGDYYGNSGGSGYTTGYRDPYYYGRRPTLPSGGAVNSRGRVMTPAPDGSGLWQEKSTGRTCWGLDCR
jgi:hypothetical protein